MLQIPGIAPDSSRYFTVLVIEDTQIHIDLIRKTCVSIIEKLGLNYSIEFKSTADEGWAIAESIPFDFYIIDGNTPGILQGPEVCRKIIAKYPKAQAVLYSAMTKEEIAGAGGVPGGVAIVNKKIIHLTKIVQDQAVHFKSLVNGRKNSADTCLG